MWPPQQAPPKSQPTTSKQSTRTPAAFSKPNSLLSTLSFFFFLLYLFSPSIFCVLDAYPSAAASYAFHHRLACTCFVTPSGSLLHEKKGVLVPARVAQWLAQKYLLTWLLLPLAQTVYTQTACSILIDLVLHRCHC